MTQRQKVAEILSKAITRSRYSSSYKWESDYINQIMEIFKKKSKTRKGVKK